LRDRPQNPGLAAIAGHFFRITDRQSALHVARVWRSHQNEANS
jgi:hypothetical protein